MEKKDNLATGREMSKILVTGGSGFLGRHLIKKLLSKYENIKIRTISRNENDIVRTLTVCHSERLEPVIGDIRNMSALKYALEGVDTVVHLAAMKHIDFCELYPSEAITINVIGTMDLLRFFEGDTFVAMSTDKAVEATNCYGATKLILEKLVLGKAREDKSRRYMIVRSGNIFASSGSVLERWRRQIEESNEIIVTNPGMSRFFIGIDIVADFIIDIIEKGETGNIYIPFQKAMRLGDLAKATIELYGDQRTEIKVIGLRKGEKLHEKLFSAEEQVITDIKDGRSEFGEQFSIEEIKSLF